MSNCGRARQSGHWEDLIIGLVGKPKKEDENTLKDDQITASETTKEEVR